MPAARAVMRFAVLAHERAVRLAPRLQTMVVRGCCDTVIAWTTDVTRQQRTSMGAGATGGWTGPHV